jgi:hypothetical protein
MKLHFASLFVLTSLSLHAAGDLSKPIEALRSVQKEGQGNEAAGKAWQEIVKADAANLPEVLNGMNGANPLAENWLRAAVGVAATLREASSRGEAVGAAAVAVACGASRCVATSAVRAG